MTEGLSPGARRLFDGERWHENVALRIAEGRVAGLEPAAAEVDLLVPGFVDLQVNGGGGVQFNADPSPAAIATICAAHRRGGTTALLATLISDRPEATGHALAAVAEARAAGQPGLAGVHLEGPHFDPTRIGTHDRAMIRPMQEADLARILQGAAGCGRVLVTLAPEAATPDQIARLARAGISVSLGHSGTDAATARACFDAGAHLVTHLFNAMSQLGHRTPGLVGAALDDGRVWCGLIADGHHVDPVAMRIALRAKAGPGRIFLVTDSMAATGSDLKAFDLGGRTVYRSEGRLTLADGTLAGADITMLEAVRYAHATLDVPLDEALRMAGRWPAEAAGLTGKGRLTPGADADYLALGAALDLQGLWIGGERMEHG